MPRRRLAFALLVLVVTAGCGGSGGGAQGSNLDADGRTAADAMATTTPMNREGAPADAAAGATPRIRARRALIFTGHVEVQVDDFQAARHNLTVAVREYGGYVSDASVRIHRVDNATYATGRLTLRVHRTNFSAMMERAKGVGRVIRASRESRDVTDQLVDVRARLRNLRAQRERLRELYRNASDTEAILRVEERLSEVQTEIERLEARQKELRNRVAMSTIEVALREPRPEPDPEPVERWYETGVIEAFLDSVAGVVVVARALVVAFAYALPYLLVFGTPLASVGYLFWRRRN